MAIVAALAVCVAVWISVMGGGAPSAPSGQSAPSAPSGKSDSYKAGYASGSPNGDAYENANKGMWGDAMRQTNRDNCYASWQDAIANRVHPWDENDFIEGCMQALQDHPPT